MNAGLDLENRSVVLYDPCEVDDSQLDCIIYKLIDVELLSLARYATNSQWVYSLDDTTKRIQLNLDANGWVLDEFVRIHTDRIEACVNKLRRHCNATPSANKSRPEDCEIHYTPDPNTEISGSDAIITKPLKFNTMIEGTSQLVCQWEAHEGRIFIARRPKTAITSENCVCIDNKTRERFFKSVKTSRTFACLNIYEIHKDKDPEMFKTWRDLMTELYEQQKAIYVKSLKST